MNIFLKKFNKISEHDLLEIEANPINFESFQIEYKLKYNGNANELRKDIVQFANSELEGFLIFGISDNPIKIIGIDKKEVDTLKLVLNNLLPKKIEPILTPFPEFNVVPLSNGRYVFLIKIIPKKNGIYGIRLHDDITNKNSKRYEFYKRMDGSKHQMNIEEIVDLIEKKSSGVKKILEVTIYPNTFISTTNIKSKLEKYFPPANVLFLIVGVGLLSDIKHKYKSVLIPYNVKIISPDFFFRLIQLDLPKNKDYLILFNKILKNVKEQNIDALKHINETIKTDLYNTTDLMNELDTKNLSEIFNFTDTSSEFLKIYMGKIKKEIEKYGASLNLPPECIETAKNLIIKAKNLDIIGINYEPIGYVGDFSEFYCKLTNKLKEFKA